MTNTVVVDAIESDPSSTEVTASIARLGRSVKLDDLPVHVVDRVKRCCLDWFGVALAGSETEAARIVTAVTCGGSSDDGSASVLGRVDRRARPGDAALINGTAAHALELDDGCPPVGHTSASIVSAALAVAQHVDATGRQFLEAVVVGQETAARVSDYVGLSHLDAGWHTTATMGTFGAAGAIASLLGLDEARWGMALGLAATQAAGIRAMFGTMSKPLHAGKAASNGVLAGLLAQAGFTSASDALEARFGFARVLSGTPDPVAAMRPLGPPYVAERIYFKRHASCGGTHAAIEAMQAITQAQQFTAADVAAIRVRIPIRRLGVCNIENPTTGLEGKFSLRYCVTAALFGWDTTGGCFDDASVGDSRAIAVMRRVEVEPIDQVTRSAPTEVEVVLRDGRRFARSQADQYNWRGAAVIDVLGTESSDAQARERSQLTAKFAALAAPVLGADRADRLRFRLDGLESIDSMRAMLT